MRCLPLLGACALIPTLCVAHPVQLAKRYDEEPVSAYLVSEKLDGIRAIWNGHQLTTRNGHLITTPEWFTRAWPDVWLDGELWSSRGQFSLIQKTVLDQEPDQASWRKIQYYVFDAPDSEQDFAHRAAFYQSYIQGLSLPHLNAIEQHEVTSNKALYAWLERVIAQGGEGLILHRKDALFKDGRSDALLKLKPYMDSEAVVVGYREGKGKYQGLVGALLVETKQGVQFGLGSGLTDALRADPPKIGAIVTYKYQGHTVNGLPRFATFIRVRKDDFSW